MSVKTRRDSIFVYLRTRRTVATAAEVREFIARHGYPVTIDTIQRDLKALIAEGVVYRWAKSALGHTWGNGRMVRYDAFGIREDYSQARVATFDTTIGPDETLKIDYATRSET